MSSDVLFYNNYSYIGDVITVIICLTYELLLHSTYTIKKKSLLLFHVCNATVATAATCSIFYHFLINQICWDYVPFIYLLRSADYILLILTLALFCVYICNLIKIKSSEKKVIQYMLIIPFILFVLLELSSPFTKTNFYIDSQLQIHQNYFLDYFRYFYVYFFCLVSVILLRNKKKFYKKVLQCLRNIIILCFLIMAIQYSFIQTSYLCLSFALPIMAALFLFHYNSYDINTGTLDHYSFSAYIRDFKAKSFSIISLHLNEMNENTIQMISRHFIRFNENHYKNFCTFRIKDNKLILVYSDEANPEAKRTFSLLLKDFNSLYKKYKFDYKIVLIHSDIILTESDDYLALDDFIAEQLPSNTAYHCKDKDMEDYLKASYILSELRDIDKKADLDDERVKVFCQPVLDTASNTFTSAEALMRMTLKECGMIYPDQFIPIAEKHGLIHTLSKIILNKTCKHIKELEKKNYDIKRVSVNFSILELKDKNFSKDIIEIIRNNQVEYSQIAIELTESQNEQDFEMVKNIMTHLQNLGMKFYLDDFGTGYSNFERIIGLPIDIIKFDRSLTILSNKNKDSEFLVTSFTDIFQKSNYQILFEGVENEEDENRCKQMNASFLQGYKYSRPIPMDELQNFLPQNANG